MTTEPRDFIPDAPPSGSLDRGNPASRRRLAPSLWVWLIVAAAAAVIVVMRRTDIVARRDLVNIFTLIAAFVATMATVIWFSFRSGYPLIARMTPIVGGPLVIGLFFTFFKIDHVTGNMVPVFRYRFSHAPDELLEKPNVSETVDLSTTTDHDFPQFLGPNRRCVVENVHLATDWAAQAPKLVWKQEIGAGWSAFSAVGDYAVTMEQRGELEMTTCYEIATGKMKWSHALRTRQSGKLGGIGPRATPTIHQGKVYAQSAGGTLLCLDGADGRLIWRRDLLNDFNISRRDEAYFIPHGRSASPLVADKLVITAAGGPGRGPKFSLAAYDKDTGREEWRAGSDQISYSSPALATFGGVRQVLIVSEHLVTGHDLTTGRQLWEYPWSGNTKSVPSVSQPVPVGDDRVFLSKGYSVGSSLLKLHPQADGTFAVEELWRAATRMKTKFTNVAVKDGYVYGLSDGIFECIDLETGRRKWKGGRYGHGQILLVGDVILVQTEMGEIVAVRATPQRREELGRFQAIDGQSWNNVCFSRPYLLVRNAEEAACYKLPPAQP